MIKHLKKMQELCELLKACPKTHEDDLYGVYFFSATTTLDEILNQTATPSNSLMRLLIKQLATCLLLNEVALKLACDNKLPATLYATSALENVLSIPYESTKKLMEALSYAQQNNEPFVSYDTAKYYVDGLESIANAIASRESKPMPIPMPSFTRETMPKA